MSKKNNKTGFKWVSAGAGYEHFGNTAIYVRFRKRKGPYKEKKTPLGCFFSLIDRELFVTTALAKRNETYTPVKGFDYCVNADLLGMGSMFKHGGVMWTYYPSDYKRSFNYDKRKASFPIFCDCVIGSTHIFTPKGMFEIRDLIEKTQKARNLYVSTPEGVQKCLHVFKSKKRTVGTLRTELNYFLTATPNELFMTNEGWKKLKEINIGDKVAIVLGKNVWPKDDIKFDFNYAEYIMEKCRDIPKQIKCKICGKIFRSLEGHLYHKHKLSVTDYRKRFDVKHTTCRQRVINAHFCQLDNYSLPKKMTLKLARLLGYLTGDGQIRPKDFRIHCGIDKDFAEDALKCFNEVFPEYEAKIEEKRTDPFQKGPVKGTGVKIYIVQSQWSAKLMAFLEHIGCPSVNARKKRVPWSILQSSKEMVLEFIKGLVECDGCVSSGIEYCSHSTKLRREVRSLLTNLGILSNLTENRTTKLPSGKIIKKGNGRIYISTKEAIKLYAKEIGFVSKRKKNKLKRRLEKIMGGRSWRKRRVIENKWLLFDNIPYWDTVVSIKKSKKKRITYDFKFKPPHIYVANGLYVHNSGGYPLKKGTLDFIYPEDLALFYNKFATRGMAIDIPIEFGVSDKLVKELARYQKKNTKNLLKGLDKGIKLYNISHGAGYEQRKMYMDIVNIPELDHWAIARSGVVSIFDLVYNIFSVITHKKAKSYHVFGIGGFKRIPILAWIGKYFNLTSDSSSALQAGRSARMLVNTNNKVQSINVGHFMDEVLHSNDIFSQLGCSCPICSAIGTSELFYKSKFSLVFILCVLHNINFYTSYTSIWDNLAQECNANEYKKQIKKHVKQDMHLWSALIDYVEEIVSTSFEKANKKFSSYLTLFHESDSLLIDNYSLFGKKNNVHEIRLRHLMNNFKRYYDGEKPIPMPEELKKSPHSFVKKMTQLSGLSKRKRSLE